MRQRLQHRALAASQPCTGKCALTLQPTAAFHHRHTRLRPGILSCLWQGARRALWGGVPRSAQPPETAYSGGGAKISRSQLGTKSLDFVLNRNRSSLLLKHKLRCPNKPCMTNKRGMTNMPASQTQAGSRARWKKVDRSGRPSIIFRVAWAGTAAQRATARSTLRSCCGCLRNDPRMLHCSS